MCVSTMNSNLSSAHKLTCRICLNIYIQEELNSLESSVGFDGQSFALLDVIVKVANVAICLNRDLLPSKICAHCTIKLIQAHKIIEKIKNSEKLLLKRLQEYLQKQQQQQEESKRAQELVKKDARAAQRNRQIEDESCVTEGDLIDDKSCNENSEYLDMEYLEDEANEPYSDIEIELCKPQVHEADNRCPQEGEEHNDDHCDESSSMHYEIDMGITDEVEKQELNEEEEEFQYIRREFAVGEEIQSNNATINDDDELPPFDTEVVWCEEFSNKPVKRTRAPRKKPDLDKQSLYQYYQTTVRGFTYTKRRDPEEHEKNYLKCDKCWRSFAKEATMQRHMEIAHTTKGDTDISDVALPAREPKGKQKVRKCPHCIYNFVRYDHYVRHLETIHGIKEKNSNHGEHARRKKVKQPCPYCGIYFPKYSLQDHIRRHTGDFPFRCELCGKGYPRKNDFIVHQRTHTGERPFICPFCNQGFITTEVLKRHVRVHTGERPFKCPKCERAFSTRADMRVHMMRHSSDTPYRCKVCSECFPDEVALQQHHEEAAETDPHHNDNLSYSWRVSSRPKPNTTASDDSESHQTIADDILLDVGGGENIATEIQISV